jgi:DNA topoisomerase-6 subunit B
MAKKTTKIAVKEKTVKVKAAAKEEGSSDTKRPTAPTSKLTPKGSGKPEDMATNDVAVPPLPPVPPETATDAQSETKPAEKSKPAYANAETMAKAQRSISVSEFFAKNRHLLGFDNPRKALLTTVKEAVDNSLDACEEAGILPTVEIWIEQLAEAVYKVVVQDNGPGIVRAQIPNVFGKLLYGSKFHRLRMSRGQQGIGISAAGMYGLLTTGKPVKITSRTGAKAKANYYELQIDTRNNKPDIMVEQTLDWEPHHGTRVEIELEARYQQGRQSVDDYLQQTAIANPHVTLVYHAPDGRVETYAASVHHLPALPKSIRPHPHGVELGVLLKMLADSKARTVRQFLTQEFSRVSPRVAVEILTKANIKPEARPRNQGGSEAKAIYEAVAKTKLMAPTSDCVVPIGEEKLVSGLKQVVQAQFYAATTRKPAVYRGNPFIIEAALAYGKPEENNASPNGKPGEGPTETQGDAETATNGQPTPEQTDEDDSASELAKLIRFANRVPLLYQQSGCATYKSVAGMNWRQYGLTQSRGALPTGPLTIVVSMASVWVPFTSESKEAIAGYPEILKEIRLALLECGRKLGVHVRSETRMRTELKKRSYIEKYIPAIGEALRDILSLPEKQVNKVCVDLKHVLERSRKM